MTTTDKRLTCFLAFAVAGSMTTLASAQEEPPAAQAAPPSAEPEPVSAGEEPDGVRFRGGISAGGGGLLVGDFAVGMGGIDGRLGAQIFDLVGVYLQPHLAFGGGKYGGQTGVTGTLGSTLVVDFTFIDQIFVGAGGGYAWVGNLTGPELHIRAGGYPLMGHGEDGIRRKGLMLGIDLHTYFVSGHTILEPMGSIGYEAF